MVEQWPGWRGGAALAAEMRDFGEYYCDLAFSLADCDYDLLYEYGSRIYERLATLGWVRRGQPLDLEDMVPCERADQSVRVLVTIPRRANISS